MKIVLLYVRVRGQQWDFYADRFVQSYLAHKPSTPHRVIVVSSLPELDDPILNQIGDYEKATYNGPAWDIGAYQAIVPKLDTDLVFCMGASVYFRKRDWIAPFITASNRAPFGLFGPQASNQCRPHIRTACFACHPNVLAEYPLKILSPEDRCTFEWAGSNTITDWAIRGGRTVKMVTASGCYDWDSWRLPPNIFRRGDQSNCLIWDRHNDVYAAATPDVKRQLEREADSK